MAGLLWVQNRIFQKSQLLPNLSLQIQKRVVGRYTYLYDGQNRRVVKKVGGTVSKQYLWFDQTRLAAELDDTGAVITEFIYGAKTNTPSYMIKSGTKYKVISDHLGSVVAIANASTGVVAQAITYDEFGRVLSDTSPGFQPLGFAGGLYDSDTGLVRFGARDYDVEIGRWTIKDPILFWLSWLPSSTALRSSIDGRKLMDQRVGLSLNFTCLPLTSMSFRSTKTGDLRMGV